MYVQIQRTCENYKNKKKQNKQLYLKCKKMYEEV